MTEGLHDFQFFTLETLVIQAVILLLILWVLNRFVFKPYLEYLDKEAEKRQKLENDYNNIEKINKEAQDQRDLLLDEAKKQAEQLRVTSNELAKKEAQMIKEQAGQEAQQMKNTALAEIGKEKEQMLQEIKQKSIDLVLKFNAKLFSKEQVNKDFVEKEISSIN